MPDNFPAPFQGGCPGWEKPVGSGQWAVVSWQWAVVSWQLAVGRNHGKRIIGLVDWWIGG